MNNSHLRKSTLDSVGCDHRLICVSRSYPSLPFAEKRAQHYPSQLCECVSVEAHNWSSRLTDSPVKFKRDICWIFFFFHSLFLSSLLPVNTQSLHTKRSSRVLDFVQSFELLVSFSSPLFSRQLLLIKRVPVKARHLALVEFFKKVFFYCLISIRDRFERKYRDSTRPHTIVECSKWLWTGLEKQFLSRMCELHYWWSITLVLVSENSDYFFVILKKKSKKNRKDENCENGNIWNLWEIIHKKKKLKWNYNKEKS